MKQIENNSIQLNTAVVLAGGQSSRLSFDKQAFHINGHLMSVFIANRLATEFDRVLIVSNKPELYKKNCPYQVVCDKWIGVGPKAGILAGLESTTDDFVYFTGCDMPFVNLPFINYMKELIKNEGKDLSVVLSVKNGYDEPFNAFYSKKLIPVLQAQLHASNYKISSIYSNQHKIYIPEKKQAEFDPHDLMFTNLNTPKDFQILQARQTFL